MPEAKSIVISYYHRDPRDPTSRISKRTDVMKVDPPVRIDPSCYRLVGKLPGRPTNDDLAVWWRLPATVVELWARGGAQAVMDRFSDRGTFVARIA